VCITVCIQYAKISTVYIHIIKAESTYVFIILHVLCMICDIIMYTYIILSYIIIHCTYICMYYVVYSLIKTSHPRDYKTVLVPHITYGTFTTRSLFQYEQKNRFCMSFIQFFFSMYPLEWFVCVHYKASPVDFEPYFLLLATNVKNNCLKIIIMNNHYLRILPAKLILCIVW
jgi:hypothetical protein